MITRLMIWGSKLLKRTHKNKNLRFLSSSYSSRVSNNFKKIRLETNGKKLNQIP